MQIYMLLIRRVQTALISEVHSISISMGGGRRSDVPLRFMVMGQDLFLFYYQPPSLD